MYVVYWSATGNTEAMANAVGEGIGADAVAVGRGILGPLLKEGREGVTKKVIEMNQQLSELMMYTGIKDVCSFDKSILYI